MHRLHIYIPAWQTVVQLHNTTQVVSMKLKLRLQLLCHVTVTVDCPGGKPGPSWQNMVSLDGLPIS